MDRFEASDSAQADRPTAGLRLTLFDPMAPVGAAVVSRHLGPATATIGRAPDNDWVLDDPRGHLSDHHCRLEFRDDGCWVADTSASGVYLNESTAALGFGNAAALAPGDRMALGDYLLTVARPDDASAPPAPSVEPAIEPARPPSAEPPAVARPAPDDRRPMSARPPMPSHAAAREILTLDRPVPQAPETSRTEPERACNDELVVAFLGAAGVGVPRLSRDQALRLMSRAGAAFREMIAGLQDGLRTQPRARRRDAADPLRGPADTEDTIARLLGLGPPGPRALDGAGDRTIREAVASIAAGPAVASRPKRRWPGRAALVAAGIVLALGADAAYRVLVVDRAGSEAAGRQAASPPAAPPPVALAPAQPPAPPPTPPQPTPQPTAQPAPVPPPRSVDRTALRRDLAQLFRGFACADLDAEIADDGAVTLTGFVSDGNDLSRLNQAVGSLPAVTRLDDRAAVRPWPFCEIAWLLRTQTADGPGAPGLAPSHPDGVYRDGDALRITATAATAEGYLYIDYFDPDGRVVHMLPTALRPDNRVAANQRVTLGAEAGKAVRRERTYVVAPPLGSGLVIALSSARPLFDGPRPELEDARDYLAVLAGALMRDPAGDDARVTASQRTIRLIAR